MVKNQISIAAEVNEASNANTEKECQDENVDTILTNTLHANEKYENRRATIKCEKEEILEMESVIIKQACIKNENYSDEEMVDTAEDNVKKEETWETNFGATTIDPLKVDATNENEVSIKIEKEKTPEMEVIHQDTIPINQSEIKTEIDIDETIIKTEEKLSTTANHSISHKLTKIGKKPYVCDVCSKSFTLKKSLYRHKMLHRSNPPHCCNICGKRFTSKALLEEHQLVHTGENPHCDVCVVNMESQEYEDKSDIRNVPKYVLREFIEIYKAHPALWQIKNKDVYGNKNLKYKGYQALVQVYKKFDPNTDIKMVKSKIQSIRGSFRKELKKVHKSLTSGSSTEEVYKPQLWYYGLLQFLSDHEIPTESVDNLDWSISMDEPVDNTSSHNDNQPEEEQQQIIPTDLPSTSDDTVQQSRKKSNKLSEADERSKFLAACTNVLKSHEKQVTEENAFGTFVTKKLEKVKDDFQRMLAEQLITKTLNYAIMGRLNEDMDVNLVSHYAPRIGNEGTSNSSYGSGISRHTNTTYCESTESTTLMPLRDNFSEYGAQNGTS